MKIFLYSSSVYSCHLFLISSASVRSITFLSFNEPSFAWNVPLAFLIFLKRSLAFPILLFSSISLHWPLRKAFLSLLVILWNSAYKWVYLSFSPLFFTSLLFTAICKGSSESHFTFLHFFFLGMVLLPVSYLLSPVQPPLSSSGTLSVRSSPLNLFLTSPIIIKDLIYVINEWSSSFPHFLYHWFWAIWLCCVLVLSYLSYFIF